MTAQRQMVLILVELAQGASHGGTVHTWRIWNNVCRELNPVPADNSVAPEYDPKSNRLTVEWLDYEHHHALWKVSYRVDFEKNLLVEVSRSGLK